MAVKRATDVLAPCFQRQAGLGRGVFGAGAGGERERQVEPAGQAFGDLAGLVVAAFFQAPGVQRHRHDEVGPAVDLMAELLGQKTGEVQALAVFVVLQQGVERVGVSVDGSGGIEGGRVFEAAAAGFAQRGGQGADRAARPGQMRQVGQAAGAERAAAGVCTAQQAGLVDARLHKRNALVQYVADNN